MIFIISLILIALPVALSTTASKHYKILSAREITSQLKYLATKYPTLCTLTTSQDLYNLPTAGSSNDCTFDPQIEGCLNYILTIQDSNVHPPHSLSDATLSEVFLSGELHGNERVGPTSVLEAASLLLESASCESYPGRPPLDINTEAGADWLLASQHANKCRDALSERGITSELRQWLARLVSTRRIVILPTPNALGYDRSERTENGIDCNRDFPFDVVNPTNCMQTICARTINEIWRQSQFQLSLTFHGGTEVIGYEWGATTYLGSTSPDDVAQVEISNGYSRYAGSFKGTRPYITGTMNDLVYDVQGGMEDWAYAASWDPNRVIPCDPETFGGYDTIKTVYQDSSLRAFNMLVETSHEKIPQYHLGTENGILDWGGNGDGNGHIARNIRLSLLAIELTEPYIIITSVNGVPIEDDIVPLAERNDRKCIQNKIMEIPMGQKKTVIEWTVGGGFTVDFTTVMFAKWDDVPEVVDGMTQPSNEDLGRAFRTLSGQSGITHWHKDGTIGKWTVFSAEIDTSEFEEGDKIALYATAQLDQEWSKLPKDSDVKPQVPPQSHLVNTRTNVDWLHESNGKVIQGRQDWYSIPATLLIGADETSKTRDLSNRFIISDEDLGGPDFTSIPEFTDEDGKWISILFAVSTVSVLLGVLLYTLRKRKVRSGKKLELFHRSEHEFIYGDNEDAIQMNQLA